jgi:hypothetical protein
MTYKSVPRQLIESLMIENIVYVLWTGVQGNILEKLTFVTEEI